MQELKLETETLKDNPISLYHSISTFAKRIKEQKVEDVDYEETRKKAELKDNNTAVSLKSGKITANDYYEELKKDADSIEKLVNMIDHKLLDKKYPSDSEEESSINSQIENIKSY